MRAIIGTRQKIILIEDSTIVTEVNLDALEKTGTQVSITLADLVDPRAAATTLLFAAAKLVGGKLETRILRAYRDISADIDDNPFHSPPEGYTNLTDIPF